MTPVVGQSRSRRSRRPVVLLIAALIGLGGLAGAAGVAFGTVAAVSGHGERHSMGSELMDAPHPHRLPTGLP